VVSATPPLQSSASRTFQARMCVRPPKKFLGSRVSTPYTPFCFICTISSELKYFLIITHLSEPGLISAGFRWTGSTPTRFQEAFRVDVYAHIPVCVCAEAFFFKPSSATLAFEAGLCVDIHTYIQFVAVCCSIATAESHDRA